MLKKLSSVVLAFIMLISIGGAAFAEYFVVDGFKENNLSAAYFKAENSSENNMIQDGVIMPIKIR